MKTYYVVNIFAVQAGGLLEFTVTSALLFHTELDAMQYGDRISDTMEEFGKRFTYRVEQVKVLP